MAASVGWAMWSLATLDVSQALGYQGCTMVALLDVGRLVSMPHIASMCFRVLVFDSRFVVTVVALSVSLLCLLWCFSASYFLLWHSISQVCLCAVCRSMFFVVAL